MRRAAVAQRLLTWPDYPIRFVPQPAWARAAAPYLYFLAYRSPAPFDRLRTVDYLVPPVDPEMPPDEQARRLRATNDSVIKLNHVIHHGGIGHHVQNWHAQRAASRIGQVAAVDCAGRIALFCGGTMAEGWACYATDLMGRSACSPRWNGTRRSTRACGWRYARWWTSNCTTARSRSTRPRPSARSGPDSARRRPGQRR